MIVIIVFGLHNNNTQTGGRERGRWGGGRGKTRKANIRKFYSNCRCSPAPRREWGLGPGGGGGIIREH